MSRPRISLREYFWLILPVAFLIVLGWWMQSTREESTPVVEVEPESKVFRLEAEPVKRPNPTAYDVWRGGDTKLHVKVNTAGDFSRINFTDWDWLEDMYVVAIKDGRRRRIDSITDGSRRILLGGYGTGGMRPTKEDPAFFQHNLLLRLHDVPLSEGALEFCWDIAYGLKPGAIAGETRADIFQKFRQNPQVVSTSVRVPLRKKGEQIEPVKVSTDPLFDIRDTKVQITPRSDGRHKIKVVWDIFYRGSVEGKEGHYLHCAQELQIVDESGKIYSSSDGGCLSKPTGGLRRYQVVHETNVLPHVSEAARKKHRWTLRGYLSINRAWLHQVTVPLDLSQLEDG